LLSGDHSACLRHFKAKAQPFRTERLALSMARVRFDPVALNLDQPITRSFFFGSVNGTGYGVGGLVGGTTTGGAGAISDSYANVDVLGTVWTGGLVGNSQDQTVTRSYATGTVSAYHNSGYVGGLIGYTSGTVAVTNSFYFGIVRVETSSANQSGAFVGKAISSGESNSYFTSYVNHSSGAALAQAHATAKTACIF
jgi:hypothetical protein